MIGERSRLSIGMAINAFGSAVTFTGLPTWVALSTGQAAHVSGLFLVQTAASLALGLFGGGIADRFSRRLISIAANAVSGLALLVLLLTLRSGVISAYYVVGTLIGMAGALSASAEMAWFGASVVLEEAESQIASRTSIVMAAKLVGMGAGPLLFASFGPWALIVDAFTYFAVAALFATAPETNASRARCAQGGGWVKLISGYREISRNTYLPLVASALAGLLTTPLMNTATQTIHRSFGGKPALISALWLIGAIGSLISNTVISRLGIPEKLRWRVVTFGSLLMAAALFAMGFATTGAAFVAVFIGFTLTNPWLTTSVSALLLRSSSPEVLGRVSALQGVVIDLAALAGISAYAGLSLDHAGTRAVWIFLPVVAARAALLARLLSRRESVCAA